MIETKVPKDIRVYETKVVGPFTFRQLICFVIMFAVDYMLYQFVIRPFHVPIEIIVYLIVLVDLPIGAFGYVKPQGIPLEKYLKNILVAQFLAPVKRLTRNEIVSTKERKITDKEQKKIDKRMKKKAVKNPELKAYL